MRRWLCLGGALALLGGGCTEFPVVLVGVCGNAVIDAKEDCDTFSPRAPSMCRPPGSIGECHYDCSVSDGKRASCPPGWGCDGLSICREPSGEFDIAARPLEIGSWSLVAGDFDGDKRGDLMSMEPLDPLGQTRLEFLYFDEHGELEDERPFPKRVIAPTVADVSGDGLSDVAFSQGPVGVMNGRSDRTWIPETFSSYRIPRSGVRVVGASNPSNPFDNPIISLIGVEDGTALGIQHSVAMFVPDPNSAKLVMRARVADHLDQLVGDPIAGDVFEDKQTSPCLETVLALRGASHFQVYETCLVDAQGNIDWRPEFEQLDIPLEPPASIDAAPQVVDMNGDGHLDVLVGGGNRAYVAYGDGKALSSAIPFDLVLAEPAPTSSGILMPLAAGEFSGDGAVDFVYPTYLLVSRPTPSGVQYSAAIRNLSRPWTSAIVGDLNANGKVDIAAASDRGLGIEFYNGTGTLAFGSVIIPTSAPVQFLTQGDLDGDLVPDLVFAEKPVSDRSKSPIKVAFGSAYATPGTPVAVAQIQSPKALSAFQQDTITNLAISSESVVDGERMGLLTFLGGNGDRVPFAAFALTEFEANSEVKDSVAMALSAGKFTSRDSVGDLLALAFPDELGAGARLTTQAWFLSEVEMAAAYPRLVPGDLDERLRGIVFSERGEFLADIASAAADLDGDGLDEAIFAMPAGPERAQCGIVVFRRFGAAGEAQATLRASQPIFIDEPCVDPQLVAVDADADEHVDLALLTGQTGQAGRKLFVLWNDGNGELSASDTQLISGEDSPQAFTVLPRLAPHGGKPVLRFAYVTGTDVRLVATGEPREFSMPSPLIRDLVGGTGIAASDLDGDGIADLAVAESGLLRVLKSQLWVK